MKKRRQKTLHSVFLLLFINFYFFIYIEWLKFKVAFYNFKSQPSISVASGTIPLDIAPDLNSVNSFLALTDTNSKFGFFFFSYISFCLIICVFFLSPIF